MPEYYEKLVRNLHLDIDRLTEIIETQENEIRDLKFELDELYRSQAYNSGD